MSSYNTLQYLKTACFTKLKEEFGYEMPSEEIKSFFFIFNGQELSNDIEGIEFEELLEKNHLENSESLYENVSAQVEFKLISRNLEHEAHLMQGTIIKREQENSEYAQLVRMLDEDGNLWNGITTIIRHGQGIV